MDETTKLTETPTVEVDQDRQTLAFTTMTTTSGFTLVTTARFLLSWCINTQPQTILADIPRTVETLQIVLQNLLGVDIADVVVQELQAAGSKFFRFDFLLGLGQRLWSEPA